MSADISFHWLDRETKPGGGPIRDAVKVSVKAWPSPNHHDKPYATITISRQLEVPPYDIHSVTIHMTPDDLFDMEAKINHAIFDAYHAGNDPDPTAAEQAAFLETGYLGQNAEDDDPGFDPTPRDVIFGELDSGMRVVMMPVAAYPEYDPGL